MANFVEFIVAGHDDIKISVNIENIRYVRPGSENSSLIYFDENHTISISGNISYISSVLESASIVK